MSKVILVSDWYNGFYENGSLSQEGKPEYLDGETLARVFPDAELYQIPQDVYDVALNGAGFPQSLADFPLSDCQKIR